MTGGIQGIRRRGDLSKPNQKGFEVGGAVDGQQRMEEICFRYGRLDEGDLA